MPLFASTLPVNVYIALSTADALLDTLIVLLKDCWSNDKASLCEHWSKDVSTADMNILFQDLLLRRKCMMGANFRHTPTVMRSSHSRLNSTSAKCLN